MLYKKIKSNITEVRDSDDKEVQYLCTDEITRIYVLGYHLLQSVNSIQEQLMVMDGDDNTKPIGFNRKRPT